MVMKSVFTFVLALSVMAGVSACSTMEGAGKDIEKAGEAVQDAFN